MNHDQQDQHKKGAGRPPLPAGQRKERVSVRLPQPLVELLRAEESPAKTITEALQDYYKDKEDDNERTGCELRCGATDGAAHAA